MTRITLYIEMKALTSYQEAVRW
ncbi:hypothetical protein BN2476_230032 [Paraburkholderia piptadeniae]|uniref:Uncharacterized protein n=1 Tax=Paraburkholderia piptadeniae TaxID=1701573 RepID=A0A1N7RWN3_9BURK|nr:hypothetical protein BN2476_230032 [Paraburkholderia piptadeniae]